MHSRLYFPTVKQLRGWFCIRRTLQKKRIWAVVSWKFTAWDKFAQSSVNLSSVTIGFIRKVAVLRLTAVEATSQDEKFYMMLKHLKRSIDLTSLEFHLKNALLGQ